jgi:hypothetical protein
VAQNVVPHLVPHDEDHFVRGEPVHQRVPQHDPLGGSETGHVGVDLPRVLALGHLVHSAALDAGPLGQRDDPGLERAVPHRSEAVEQRVDPDRRHHQRQRRERNGRDTGPEPPPVRAPAQQQIRDPEREGHDHTTDADGLGAVAEEL